MFCSKIAYNYCFPCHYLVYICIMTLFHLIFHISLQAVAVLVNVQHTTVNIFTILLVAWMHLFKSFCVYDPVLLSQHKSISPNEAPCFHLQLDTVLSVDLILVKYVRVYSAKFIYLHFQILSSCSPWCKSSTLHIGCM